ncbi:MAG: Asp23/Gls24 family envelope stress response protein [Brevefilum sp.]
MAETEKNNQHNELGSILIQKDAIASIARQSTLQSYGVVGLSPKNLFESIRQFLVKDGKYGVDVEYDHDGLLIDLFIIVEYGTRIKSITNSIVNSVKYNVEKTVGLPVRRINVHVRGLRISNMD